MTKRLHLVIQIWMFLLALATTLFLNRHSFAHGSSFVKKTVDEEAIVRTADKTVEWVITEIRYESPEGL